MKKTISLILIFSILLSMTLVLAYDGVTTLNAHGPATISIEVPDSIDFGEVEAGENYYYTDKSIKTEINNTGNTDISLTLSFESGYEGIFLNSWVSETKGNQSNDYLYSDFVLEIPTMDHDHFYIWLDLTNVTEEIAYENQEADLIYTAVPL